MTQNSILKGPKISNHKQENSSIQKIPIRLRLISIINQKESHGTDSKKDIHIQNQNQKLLVFQLIKSKKIYSKLSHKTTLMLRWETQSWKNIRQMESRVILMIRLRKNLVVRDLSVIEIKFWLNLEIFPVSRISCHQLWQRLTQTRK